MKGPRGDVLMYGGEATLGNRWMGPPKLHPQTEFDIELEGVSLMDNLALAAIAAAVPVLFVGGWMTRRWIDKAKIGSAEDIAQRIRDDAEKESATLKKSIELEAKDKWLSEKQKLDADTEERRADILKLEGLLADRETKLDRKVDIISTKEQAIGERERDLGQQERGLEQETERLRLLIDEQNVRLERIAGMTAEEAKTALLANVEEQARHEGSRMAKQIKERAQEGAQKEAREIIGMAIQRYASEHTAETTVSVVQLPNEEMKGRVIGREGRNIRAFEIATGIDVIVDDTPEAVILSGFDRVRREVARIALQRLVEDGRIHPLRIEEAVEKAREELEEDMKRAGEEASFEVGILDLHPEIIKMLGRLRFRTSYGQNVLQHSKEVAILAGLMAQQMGIDVKLACRSGLLHDVGKAIDRESDGTHTELGVELAQRYGEPPQVINAIASHHEDHEATSFYAVLADAADAISSSRPGARRETVDGYVKRLERLEELAQSFNGVDKTYAVQAGREVRVIVDCRTVGDPDAELLATDIAEKIEADMEYPGQIKVVVIRESRAVGIAK